jgi:hypothetical protein
MTCLSGICDLDPLVGRPEARADLPHRQPVQRADEADDLASTLGLISP